MNQDNGSDISVLIAASTMDGGGSTTLAWWNPDIPDSDNCELLNFPVGNGVKGGLPPGSPFQPTERASGNNLGVVLNMPDSTEDSGLCLIADDHRIEQQVCFPRVCNRVRLREPPNLRFPGSAIDEPPAVDGAMN